VAIGERVARFRRANVAGDAMFLTVSLSYGVGTYRRHEHFPSA
jgi:hypothetical protein